MISYVQGVVQEVSDHSITVDIGTVGLSVQVPHPTSFAQGKSTKLHVHMHWNQEQGPSLFGFQTELEKTIFLLVIGCSGLGPKLGITILESLGAERFLEIVRAEDERALSQVSGIGPKKAEQIIVHLKHKVAKLIDSGIHITCASTITQWHNIAQVLESLNYSRLEVAQAIKYLREKETQPDVPFDLLMRKALSFLAKKV